MPKVDIIYFKLEGEHMEVRAMFNTKENFYISKDEWPDKISTTISQRRPTDFLTLNSLKDRVRVMVKQYHQEIEQITRVIRYRISSGMSFHWTRNGVSGASKKSDANYGWMATLGNHDYGEAGIAISYMICNKKVNNTTSYQEIVIQDGKEIQGSWFEPRKSGDDEYHEMDYTEERHQFFINTHETISKLTKMVGDFFNPKDDTIKKIEEKQKLLS
jgi:hypothetical protein